MDPVQIPESLEPENMPKPVRRVMRWLARLGILMVFLFFTVFIMLQIPFFQNWAAEKITNFLSERLQSKVSVDYVSIAFFDKLILDGVYVEDHRGDTLLFVQRIKANLNSGPLAWFNSRLSFDDITLEKPKLLIHRADGDAKSTLAIFLQKFKKPGPKKKSPFFFDLDQLHLKQAFVLNSDSVRGEDQIFQVLKGDILIKEMDIDRKRLIFRSIDLKQPLVKIIKYVQGTAPLHTDEPESTTSDPESIAVADTLALDTTKLFVQAGKLFLDGGEFQMRNWRFNAEKLTPDSVFDARHLVFQNIIMVHENIEFKEKELVSRLKHLSLDESSGFKLIELAANEFRFSSNALIFNQMRLETPFSMMGDTFSMKFNGFGEFSDFNNNILMDGRFHNASVAMKDIMVFAPTLERNPFFASNREEVLTLDGRISGRVNNLRGRELNIKLAKGAIFEGGFSSRNLAVKNEEFVNLRIDRLRTSIQTLKELIPSFNPPANFMKLGRLDFKGSFDGFFQDFVAYGDLRTDMGRAVTDMRLNLIGGREKAEYQGKLSLLDFDLQKWTSDPEFGKITLISELKEGKGLTGNSATAKLYARIDSVVYRNYHYNNIVMNGALEKNLFDGQLDIRDQNIDLNFAGQIDFRDSIPVFDFSSKVQKLNLKKLNFSKQDLDLAGDIALQLVDTRISNMTGKVSIRDFRMVKDQKETFQADSIVASSTFEAGGDKNFTVHSDILAARLIGDFDIEQIPDQVMAYLQKNFPDFYKRFGLKPIEKTLKPTRFEYDIQIRDARNFTHLIDPKIDSLKDVHFKGFFGNTADSLMVSLDIPTFKVNNWMFYDIAVESKLEGSEGNLDVAVSKSILNEKNEFSPVTVLGFLQRDTYEFAVSSFAPILNTIDHLNLNGKFYLKDDDYQIQFLPSNVVILQQQWDISADNFIRFGKNKIETKNFEFKNGKQSILLESVGEKGLKAEFVNFDLTFINPLWKYDPLQFRGKFTFTAVSRDIFKLQDLSAVGRIDSFFINKDYFGKANIELTWPELKSPLQAKIDITEGEQRLVANGFYLTPSASRSAKKAPFTSLPGNYFETDISVSKYPFKILEYFIGTAISETKGLVDAEIRIEGYPKKPSISGKARITNASVKINYLQTTYSIVDGFVNITNSMFDATGGKLTDRMGNTAVIFGGITHTNLKNFGLDVRVVSDKFLMLDTKKENNPLYYGRGIGRGDIRFTGSFKQTNILINAVAEKGTRVVMPINSGQSASEVKFVRFRDKSKIITKQPERSTLTELRGINLDMRLTVTQDAEILLVFDERAGDIIRGNGRGDLQINITRDGEFRMFGNYEIEQGEYLFTLLNLVNKPFTVNRGGTIRWFGDPFGAEINLVAEYKGLTASISNLIKEYVQLLPAEIKREAAKPTEVDLTMRLSGELLKPDIRFDIDFPQLTGDLKNYAQSKLRLIKQDQNELNRQVFGLIVVGQFLPSSTQISGREVGINTVTELLSNQLSLYLTDLLTEVVNDVKFISGVDFDIAYSYYESPDLLSGEDGLNYTGTELQFRLKNYLFNDRLTINFGGNFNIDDNSGLGTTVNAGTFTAGDIIFEYAISEDRRLKLKAYASQEVVIGGGTKRQYGAGISFRHEFDNFKEFLNGFKKQSRLNN